MKKYKWVIILLNLIILLGLFNRSMLKKEKLISNGQLILLELAPVDPRSLMQGDYMQLDYAISSDMNKPNDKTGYCVVRLQENGVAKKVRLQKNKTPINDNEYSIRYNERAWSGISIGAESFFFQEGDGPKYEKAQYGGLRVDTDGNSLLVGLYDSSRVKIE